MHGGGQMSMQGRWAAQQTSVEMWISTVFFSETVKAKKCVSSLVWLGQRVQRKGTRLMGQARNNAEQMWCSVVQARQHRGAGGIRGAKRRPKPRSMIRDPPT